MASPSCHSLRVIGLDKEQRPVMYYHFGQSLGRSNVQHNTQHLMRLLEECTRIMDSERTPSALCSPLHQHPASSNPSRVGAALVFAHERQRQ